MEQAKQSGLESTPERLQFGGFALLPDRGTLQRPDGTEARLRPKTAELLRHLLERAGRVVRREEILEALWPGVYVGDDSITQCVTEIRRALGEEGGGLLRTLPKRGYILAETAPVAQPPPGQARVPDDIVPAADRLPEQIVPAAARPPEQEVRRRRRWPLISGIGAAAIVTSVYFLWVFYSDTGRHLVDIGSVTKPDEAATVISAARLEARSSVAVLPFKNLSGDAAHDFFSDGITEDVIAALGRFSNLLVISKSSSFQFKNSTIAPAEIGRLMNARYLLDGSIRRSGDRVRVGVQLIEASTGRLVWSETYNAEIDNIFAVQDTIAKSVVGAAAVELTRFERERVLAKPTSNLAAYEYVLRGRGAWSHETRESNDEAIDLFQRAIDLDPNYADAYAALGSAYVEAVVSGWSEFRTEELERAEALAQKALSLNPATTRAYHVLSSVHLFRKRYDLALAQIDRALKFNPSDADNYVQRGTMLVWAGRAEEALQWLEGALHFDRANGAAAARLCMAYYLLRRYAEAVDACDLGLSRNAGRNTQMTTHVHFAATYAALNREQDTKRERAIVARLWPFFDARTFAAQFGTEEARNHMLEGLKKAGFR